MQRRIQRRLEAIENKDAPKSVVNPKYEICDATGIGAIKIMEKESIATNLLLDPLYQSGEINRILWVDPLLVYLQKGHAFGPTIKFDGAIVSIPKEFQGLTNAALVMPSKSFYTKSHKGQLLILSRDKNKITLVENFPTTDGFYLLDQKTGIPYGNEVPWFNPQARYLYRREDGPYIGLMARGYFRTYDRRFIVANNELSVKFGVMTLEFNSLAKNIRTASMTKTSENITGLFRNGKTIQA